ncbi:MAG: SpoVR family protein, partial [Pseudomonadota bacterium]
MSPISTGYDWDFDLIERYDTAIGAAAAEYGLDTYPNQIEIISSEQMLDAYASSGLPMGYPHWSYGTEFIRNERAYRNGAQGLAYEIVINSNPCIAYLMEENSIMMQALVVAHASYGHNSFFKGNYLFRQSTSADSILDYLVFARRYVMECEERHGTGAVEEVLDSCHALMQHGVDRYKRPAPLSLRGEEARAAQREEHVRKQFNDLWRTVPSSASVANAAGTTRFPVEPEENILYFVEKHSPKLCPWQRELVRIVRKLAQYFYPQAQTKVMNEGWATFWHYTLINRLYEQGQVDDGFMLEFLQSHTNVVRQSGFDAPG